MKNVLQKLREKEPVTIVVVGDSNTLVSMNTQGHMNWVGYLTEALWERYGDGLVTMVNVSECGYNFARLAGQLDAKVRRWQPDLVITQLWLCGHDDNYNEAQQTFRTCIDDMRANRPELDILVCTPNPNVLCPGHELPEGTVAGEVYETAFWNSERNAGLVEVATEKGCDVVDHFTAWQRQTYEYAHAGANPRGLWQRMIDTIHPNALGHRVLFRELADAFDVARHFPWEEPDTP